MYVYASCYGLAQFTSVRCIVFTTSDDCLQIITWYFTRSKSSAFSAVFLYICSCLQTTRIEQLFLNYFCVETHRTRTVVLWSSQSSVHTSDVWPNTVGHEGPFFCPMEFLLPVSKAKCAGIWIFITKDR